MNLATNFNDLQFMHQGKKTQSLNADDAKLIAPIAVKGSGKAKALLLLHGYTSTPAVYRLLLPSLDMYDAIACPVLPGHAASIDAFTHVKAEEWIHCAEQTCQELTSIYQSVDVLGLSLGGLLACHLSQKFKINHLFLLAPAMFLPHPTSFLLTIARVANWLGIRRIPNRAGNIYTKGHAELVYRQIPVTTIIELLMLMKRFKWHIPLHCPVDLFLGRYDNVVNSRKIATRCAGLSNVHIHWLERSAHVLPLDGDVDKIIACIRASHA